MNRTELAAVWPPDIRIARLAGHRSMSPMQAIRRKCLDCSGHQISEVKLCETVNCSLWPFRAGRHPYTKTRLLEADSEESGCSGASQPPNYLSSEIGPQEASGAQGEHI